MKKVPFIPQHDESDCGAACLASILLFYGKYASLRNIREHCGTDRDGTSGYGIVKGAEHFGLYCKCGFSEEKELSDMPLARYAKMQVKNSKMSKCDKKLRIFYKKTAKS